MILSVKPSIEELIRQTTGKSFEEMTDEELINLVNSTRNCYQMLSGAAKARKARRSRPSTTTATDWSTGPVLLRRLLQTGVVLSWIKTTKKKGPLQT